MIHPYEYFRSVEHIWVIWLISLALFLLSSWLLLRKMRWEGWKRLFQDESGAAYSISYVMAFPFYVLLIALILESTQLLIVKMGTVYAAYAAARSGSVWLSAYPDVPPRNRAATHQRAHDMSHRAAVQALTPFASPSTLFQQGNPSGVGGGSLGQWYGKPNRFQTTQEREVYATAYKEFAGERAVASRKSLLSRYKYASWATRIKIEKKNSKTRYVENLTVTVEYKAPLYIPVIARILGDRQADPPLTPLPFHIPVPPVTRKPPWPGARHWVRTMQSSVTLESEAPKNKEQTLGIEYHGRH